MVVVEILRQGDLAPRPVEEVGLAVTDEAAQRPVDLEPAPVGGHQSHADGRVGERLVEFLLGRASGPVELPGSGYVGDHRDGSLVGALIVEDRGRVQAALHDGAVLAQERELVGLGDSLAPSFDLVVGEFSGVGVYELE